MLRVDKDVFWFCTVKSDIRDIDKSEFVYLILNNHCIYRAFRHLCFRYLCIFPCFCPYEQLQGKVFYPPTTLSSNPAVVRFASLVA